MKKNPGMFPCADRTGLLLFQARDLMTAYSRATGASVTIYGHDYQPAAGDSGKPCRAQGGPAAGPCRDLHINAIEESRGTGLYRVYGCPAGFVFWVSPVYAGGCFAGALLASGFRGNGSGEAREKIPGACGNVLGGTGSLREAGSVPEAGAGRINALAELLLICARHLSAGSGDSVDAAGHRQEEQPELQEKISAFKSRYPPGSAMPEYPLHEEQSMLEALRRGDAGEAKRILAGILAFLFCTASGKVKHMQPRATELAVLISREGTTAGTPAKTVLGNYSRHTDAVEKAENFGELCGALYRILDGAAGQMRWFQGIRHAPAMKTAQNYIIENFSRKISLEEIARASGFSAPYFSTIFKEEMGENLSSYLNRLRVEKAGYLLTETKIPLCKIARLCGFEDQSWFSKIFKSFTGLSPGKYRNRGGSRAAETPEAGLSGEYRLLMGLTGNAGPGENSGGA